MSKNLKCKQCRNVLIRIGDDGHVKAEGVALENILGFAPKAGDIFRLTCKCGFKVISCTPDYLVEEKI